MFEQSSNEIGKAITIGNREPLSETQSLFSKTKWQWRSPSVDKNGLDNNFNSSARAWSNNHMYRTHYQDMSEKVRNNFKLFCHLRSEMHEETTNKNTVNNFDIV